MSGVTYLQESEGYAKYDTTSYKGRIGARQDKRVAHDACCHLTCFRILYPPVRMVREERKQQVILISQNWGVSQSRQILTDLLSENRNHQMHNIH